MSDTRRMFEAAFECPQCSHVIEIRTWLAIVKGPGLEIGCIGCKTMFLVTEKGATAITDMDLRKMSHVDAEGKLYESASGNSSE